MVTNWSKPAQGTKGDMVNIDELYTYPKNPLIVNVFRELGWVEELGSGFRNIKKYAPLYYAYSVIEIRNCERFVFSMTYQNVVDDVYTLANNVKKGKGETSNDVNRCENSDSTTINDTSSVNKGEFDPYTIARDLISEFIPSISGKIADRMSEEIAAIYYAKQLTKNELKEKLGLSDEQVKIDLKELTRNRLLDQKGKEKKYMLSEKFPAKSCNSEHKYRLSDSCARIYFSSY